jgi:hypothetical protein
VDAAVAQNISAVERMKKLLTAPDKKAMILEMAEVRCVWLVAVRMRVRCPARVLAAHVVALPACGTLTHAVMLHFATAVTPRHAGQ